MTSTRPTRWHLVNSARLHHVVCAIGTLYYGWTGGGSLWSGDDAAGDYLYDNGQGDTYTIRWWPPAADDVSQPDEPGPIIGLVFAHESERSQWNVAEADRDPLRYLDDMPSRLRSKAKQVAASMEKLVTAGFWATGWAESQWSGPVSVSLDFAHGLEMFAGYLLPDEGAMFSTQFQNWSELQSVEPDDEDDPASPARIAMALARQSRGGQPVTISRADARRLLRGHPEGQEIAAIHRAAAEEMLAAVGIHFPEDAG